MSARDPPKPRRSPTSGPPRTQRVFHQPQRRRSPRYDQPQPACCPDRTAVRCSERHFSTPFCPDRTPRRAGRRREPPSEPAGTRKRFPLVEPGRSRVDLRPWQWWELTMRSAAGEQKSDPSSPPCIVLPAALPPQPQPNPRAQLRGCPQSARPLSLHVVPPGGSNCR